MSAYGERYPEKSSDCIYVYIAGPMRGFDAYNFPAFFEAEKALVDGGLIEGRGVVTFNPAANDMWRHNLRNMDPLAAGRWLIDHPEEPSNDIRVCMAEDCAWISKFADVVCVLPGWENSKGAKAEVALARSIGADVWYFEPCPALECSCPGGTFRAMDDDGNTTPVGAVDLGVEVTHFVANDANTVYDPVEVEGFCANCGHHRDEHLPGQSRWSCLFLDVVTGNNLVDSVKTKYDGHTVSTEPVVNWSYDPPLTEHFDVHLEEMTEPVLSGEIRTKSSTGGEKGMKLARYDLIPVMPLRLLAEHYGRGAAKYADNQWRQGYEFSKSIAAKQRHFEAWRGGEDYDVCPADGYGCRHTDMDGKPFVGVPSEHGPTCFNHTGSHHLTADLWHSMFLLEGSEHWPEHDDRFTYQKG